MRWLGLLFNIALLFFILVNGSSASYYTVKPGDSLIKISKKLGVKPKLIKRLNPQIKWLRIKPGEKISVPAVSAPKHKSFSYNKNVYIVKRGDSLLRIAKITKIKAALIKRHNPNVNWSKIRPGDKIIIPKPKIVKKFKPKKDVYVIKKNDSLIRISKRLNINIKEIENLNPDVDWSKIRPKSEIKIPEKPSVTVAEQTEKIVKAKLQNAPQNKVSVIKKCVFKKKISFKPGEIGDGYYIVKSGDTLSSIARRFGLSLKHLMALNPNKSRFIKPKELIVLPGELTKKIMLSEKENLYIPPRYLVYSTPYKVKSGDSLYKIARKFHTKVYVIKMLNNIGGNRLIAGSFLFVPNKDMVNKNKLELEYSLLREKRRALISYAERFLGRPYRFGGESLLHGIDCSAFIQKIYERFIRMRIPRTAEAQYRTIGVFVPLNRIQVGDLLFFHTLSYARVTHVGIYIGNNRFIHAAGRRSGIKISKLSRYYMKRLVGVKRILSVSNKYVYFRHRSG